MERFRHPDGREMNGFFMYKTLSDAEGVICRFLVDKGGPLGLDKEEITEAQIDLDELQALVESGIVKKCTLFEIAQEVVKDEEFARRKAHLEEDGGYFGTDDEGDRLFINCLDLAHEIVQSGDAEGNSEIYYQIAIRRLYNFLEILL